MHSRRTIMIAAVAAGLSALGTQGSWAQGVTDKEIVIGTHQDLSGPVVSWGQPVSNGMKMAVDEINAAGGINGRQIKLLLEDDGYDPKKTLLVTQKLITQDQILALVGPMGAATSGPVMPWVLKQGVPHLFPVASSEIFYEPFDKLKFSIFTPWSSQTYNATKWFHKNKGLKKVGALVQDDEFGASVQRGVEQAAKELNIPAVVVTYKRGSTDFSSQIARLKSEDVGMIALGTPIRESVAAANEAQKAGWKVDMLVTTSGFAPEVIKLGGDNVEGLWGSAQTPIPYMENAGPELKKWMEAYKARFNSDPNPQAVIGYQIISLFAEGAKHAGKDLNRETLVQGLEKVKDWKDIFGTAPMSFGPDRRLATNTPILFQVQKGKWVKVADF